jgi:hypothetical protein
MLCNKTSHLTASVTATPTTDTDTYTGIVIEFTITDFHFINNLNACASILAPVNALCGFGSVGI